MSVIMTVTLLGSFRQVSKKNKEAYMLEKKRQLQCFVITITIYNNDIII